MSLSRSSIGIYRSIPILVQTPLCTITVEMTLSKTTVWSKSFPKFEPLLHQARLIPHEEKLITTYLNLEFVATTSGITSWYWTSLVHFNIIGTYFVMQYTQSNVLKNSGCTALGGGASFFSGSKSHNLGRWTLR